MFIVSVIQEPGVANKSFAGVFKQAEGGTALQGLEMVGLISTDTGVAKLSQCFEKQSNNFTGEESVEGYHAQRHALWFMRGMTWSLSSYPSQGVCRWRQESVLMALSAGLVQHFLWPWPAYPGQGMLCGVQLSLPKDLLQEKT